MVDINVLNWFCCMQFVLAVFLKTGLKLHLSMVIQISEIFIGGHEVAEVASFLFAGCWGMIFFKAPKESLSPSVLPSPYP